VSNPNFYPAIFCAQQKIGLVEQTSPMLSTQDSLEKMIAKSGIFINVKAVMPGAFCTGSRLLSFVMLRGRFAGAALETHLLLVGKNLQKRNWMKRICCGWSCQNRRVKKGICEK